LQKLRIPGVLQRFSITYFVVATTGVAFIETLEPKYAVEKSENKVLNLLKDLICLWPRWIVCAIFLVSHCILTFSLPVPGCPTGYLGPGGLHNDNETLGENCVGGSAGFIDRTFFGVQHIYGNPTSKGVYLSGAYDPEGLLGLKFIYKEVICILPKWVWVVCRFFYLCGPSISRIPSWSNYHDLQRSQGQNHKISCLGSYYRSHWFWS